METLTKAEADLFYKLWRPLLQYVNCLQKLYPKIDFAKDEKLDVQKCGEVAAWLWEHVNVIDDFLADHPEFSTRESSIAAGWKHRVRDHFLVERHLKSGSVFIGGDHQVYLVQGIISSYEEMFWCYRLPIYVQATLIPFKDHLITDGLIGVLPVIAGPGIRRMAREEYMEAKRAGVIITKLPAGSQRETEKLAPASVKKAAPKKNGKKGSSGGKQARTVEEKPTVKGNQKYLDMFEQDLRKTNLSPKTIEKHLSNADLFLNDFLCDREEVTMESGVGFIGIFMTLFFIPKCMWSTGNAVKQTAVSIRKFYKCMAEHHLISEEDYQDVVDKIKRDKDDWVEEAEAQFDEFF